MQHFNKLFRRAEFLWRIVAYIVTRPAVTDWLIRRARRTPYTNITSRDGTDTYMMRLWLFNPYPDPLKGAPDPRAKWLQGMPSIRLHHILRSDSNIDHPHDHPWDARTIVLGPKGYAEERPTSLSDTKRTVHYRERGYTGPLQLGQYHVITWVPPGGVWTLFITWKKQGTWGFLVDGQKVSWRKYLGLEQQ